jgi:predicted DNA-binding transcriptional regulator YafY
MKTLKQLECLRKIHKLIRNENTGTPLEFAIKLHLSQRQLYNLLEKLKEMEAPIQYCRKSATYYYNDDFDLLVNISVQILINHETKTIYAGQTALSKNSFTAMLVQ